MITITINLDDHGNIISSTTKKTEGEDEPDTLYVVIWNENACQVNNVRGAFKEYDDAYAQATKTPCESNGDVYIMFIQNETDPLDDRMVIFDFEHVVGTKIFTCPECKNGQKKYGVLKEINGTKDKCNACGFGFMWGD